MPTINYDFEPTDKVYFIDKCEKMQTEAVVQGTIYRIDITVRGVAVSPTIEAVEGVEGVAYEPAIAQVPTPEKIIEAKVSAGIYKALNLDPAIEKRDNAKLVFEVAVQALNILYSEVDENDVEEARVALQDSENDVILAQHAYDAILAGAVITTEAKDEVLAVEAVEAVEAADAVFADLEFVYVIQTIYNQEVRIDDPSLLFRNKEDAFDVLMERVV